MATAVTIGGARLTRMTHIRIPHHAHDHGAIVPSMLYAVSLVLVTVGVGLALLGDDLTAFLNGPLPDAATVRSDGTKYPSFADIRGWGYQLRLLGVVVAAVPIGALLSLHPDVSRLASELSNRLSSRYLLALALLLAVSFALYAYLAYPPNAWPSNARMHWLDQFYGRSDHFFYTLVKLPHVVFYEMPHIWQGINGALSVALTYGIGRQVFRPRWGAFLLAIGFLLSSNMLMFANMAEDVSVAVTALLLAVYAYTRNCIYGFGVALFIVFLARPQLSLLAGAFVVTHAIYWARDRQTERVGSRLLNGLREPFFLRNIAVFVALFVVWGIVLTALDARYFLTGSGLIDQASFLDLEPRSVDGFLLTPFSGAYFYHFLWVYPLPLLLANAYVAVRFRRLSRSGQQLFIWCWIFILGSLVFLEAATTSYYNVRYITYYWPLVLVAGSLAPTILRIRGFKKRRFGTVAIVSILLLSVVTPYTDAFSRRAEIEGRDLTTLYADRHEIRELVEGRKGKVYSTYTAHTQKNYVAFILKEPFGVVKGMKSGMRLPDQSFLIRPSEADYGNAEVVYQNGTIELVRSRGDGDG